jgi:quaternary ammonium compound-resistance protein SugE
LPRITQHSGIYYWSFLFLAALLEAAWTFSLKFMQFSELKKLNWQNFYQPQNGLKVLLPFTGYILFGVGNVYCFSIATKHIPLAIAFAAWTGISLILIKISEVAFFHQKVALMEIFFMLMIMGGIMGLRAYSVAAATP